MNWSRIQERCHFCVLEAQSHYPFSSDNQEFQTRFSQCNVPFTDIHSVSPRKYTRPLHLCEWLCFVIWLYVFLRKAKQRASEFLLASEARISAFNFLHSSRGAKSCLYPAWARLGSAWIRSLLVELMYGMVCINVGLMSVPWYPRPSAM